MKNIAILLLLVTSCYGAIITEGKTKIVRSYDEDATLAIFESKDVITAFDVKREPMANKSRYANQTTCNVFRFLAAHNIPLAFKKQIDERSFLADYCKMIELEVVVRREAHGSYLKRYPTFAKGDVFPELVVEYFLKTSDKNWHGTPIPKDDPFMQFTDAGAELYLPHMPFAEQKPFLVLTTYPLHDQPELLAKTGEIAKQSFLLLEDAWKKEGARLVDYKVEFGINANGDLVLADVIDNDSWRVVMNEGYIDKQYYRDGGEMDEVIARYKYVSELTGHFE